MKRVGTSVCGAVSPRSRLPATGEAALGGPVHQNGWWWASQHHVFQWRPHALSSTPQSLLVTRLFFLTNITTLSEHHWASGGENNISCCAWETTPWERRGHPLVGTEEAMKNPRRCHWIHTRETGPVESSRDAIPSPQMSNGRENYSHNTVISSIDMRKELSLISTMH